MQFMLEASDQEGDLLTYEIVTTSNNGILTIIDNTTGEVVYTPDLNFNASF